MKFRKKSIVIEAEQYIAEKHEPEGLCWELGHGCDCPHLHTLEGVHIVSDGDWVITGVKGEKYPCKPDIFDMTYEKAEVARLPESISVESVGKDSEISSAQSTAGLKDKG